MYIRTLETMWPTTAAAHTAKS